MAKATAQEQQAAYDQLGKLTVAQYYAQLVNGASDDSVTINGVTVTGILTKLRGEAPAYAVLNSYFPNMKALWHAQGVTPGRTIARTDFLREVSSALSVWNKPATAKPKSLGLLGMADGLCNMFSFSKVSPGDVTLRQPLSLDFFKAPSSSSYISTLNRFIQAGGTQTAGTVGADSKVYIWNVKPTSSQSVMSVRRTTLPFGETQYVLSDTTQQPQFPGLPANDQRKITTDSNGDVTFDTLQNSNYPAFPPLDFNPDACDATSPIDEDDEDGTL